EGVRARAVARALPILLPLRVPAPLSRVGGTRRTLPHAAAAPGRVDRVYPSLLAAVARSRDGRPRPVRQRVLPAVRRRRGTAPPRAPIRAGGRVRDGCRGTGSLRLVGDPPAVRPVARRPAGPGRNPRPARL